MTTKIAGDAVYRADVRIAWDRYLSETRKYLSAYRDDRLGYEEHEPDAWARLRSALDQAEADHKERRRRSEQGTTTD